MQPEESTYLLICLFAHCHVSVQAAMLAGRTSTADQLVFAPETGSVIRPDNIVPRYMQPALEKAGPPENPTKF